MSGPVFHLMLLFCAVSLLIMGISVPLLRGKVKPNRVYGVRTPKTLRSERFWYPANSFGGRTLFRTGLAQLFAVVAFALFPPAHANLLVYIGVCEAVILLSLLAAGIRIMLFVRNL